MPIPTPSPTPVHMFVATVYFVVFATSVANQTNSHCETNLLRQLEDIFWKTLEQMILIANLTPAL